MRPESWTLDPDEAEVIRDALVYALSEMGIGDDDALPPADTPERRGYEARVRDIAKALARVGSPYGRGWERLEARDLHFVIPALRAYAHTRFMCATEHPLPEDDGEFVAVVAGELADVLERYA